MNLDDALQTYVAESRELLEDMDSALLRLEDLDRDGLAEQLNAIFRAAHTIKGSAGLFALEDVVAFTHELESLLDLMREGGLEISGELVSTLLECKDHLVLLIDEVADGRTRISDTLRRRSDQLIGALLEHSPRNAPPPATTVQTAQVEMETARETSGPVAATDDWHISLRFGRNSLRDGMDPLSFLRYLATLGEIRSLVTLQQDLPAIDDFDPESCYLGFELRFASDADKRAIEDVFEFVREDSDIRILPPHSRIEEYIESIGVLPGQHLRLGEILVECGSLTRHELDRALATQEQLNDWAEHRPLGEILVEQGSAVAPVVEAAARQQSLARDPLAQDNQSIRVDARRLDVLINLIGELVTGGAGAALHARATADSSLIESVTKLTGLIEEVRDVALKLRMVQIGATFNRFKRVVRDVSKELGKSIQLEISGGDTELDKTVVEKICDPLMHLVRNAIDHGIEPAERRLAAGKAKAGKLRLHAYHDSGTMVIEVSDDGAGLDAEKIRAKAIDKGLITEDQSLDTRELIDLIFEPGFSTANAVTNLSGRGVGMDVVRRNISELGGRIQVDTWPGEGTAFTISLPLTLAIIDGFLIGVQDAHFVVPLDSVLECVELSDDGDASRGRHYMQLRNEVLPFIRLRELFSMSGETPRRENVVVVRHAGGKAGLVVDRLHGEFQTVIKPLGPIFSRLEGVGGSTIMGNGEVALILDVAALVTKAIEQQSIQTQRV